MGRTNQGNDTVRLTDMTPDQLREEMRKMAATPGKNARMRYARALDEAIRRERAA